MRTEVRRELFKVTERRDGRIYKTKSLGYFWVPIGTPTHEADALATAKGGDFWVAPSTSYPGTTMRTLRDDGTVLGELK